MKSFQPLFNRLAACLLSLGFLASSENLFAQRPLGLDVAQYQGFVNWTNVSASGITFAWVAATESTDFTDPLFASNIVSAKAAGIPVGCYHFAHPEDNLGIAGADAEAAYFWSVVSNYVVGDSLSLMPVLEFETAPGGYYSTNTATAWVNEWCADVVNYGFANGVILNPVVYTDSSIAGSWLNGTVNQWPLWITGSDTNNPQTGAPASTAPWTNWTVWQYNQGTNAGITNGLVNEDVFNGTTSTLVSNLVVATNKVLLYYYDPQGTNGPNPYTNSMSGAWESDSWSASTNGRIVPVGWYEGQAAVLGVHTGLGTPPFTITMNQNHTVAGVFNDLYAGYACAVTIAGPGIMTFQVRQGFSAANTSDGSLGSIIFSNVIAGSGQFVAESSGQLYLNGSNTYAGETLLGGNAAGEVFSGTINFNNNSSFGASEIVLSAFGNGGTLAAEGPSPIAIPNSVIVSNTTTNIFIGNAAGVTYSGNWTLGTSKFTFGTGPAPGLLDIISGVISGSSNFTVYGSGTLSLNGLNTHNGAITIRNASTLTIGGAGELDLGAYGNKITNNGTFTYASSASQTLSGVISGSGALNQNGPGKLTLNGANTYAGNTTISAGALALGSAGSINNSPLISIGAGATFDVSALAAYILSTNTALSASGTASPATIIGGASVSLGSQPIILNYDGSHPALTVSQGTLLLNGNAFTVNGPTLPGGVYTIIQQTTGNIAGSGSLTATGTAIPATAAISISNGAVLLTITNAAPVTINTPTHLANGSVQLNFSGNPGYTYLIEAATNLTAPITWTILSTNVADVHGLFNFTDLNAANYTNRYYRTAVP